MIHTPALEDAIAALGGDAFLALKGYQAHGSGSFHTPPQLGGLVAPIPRLTFTVSTEGRMRVDAVTVAGSLTLVHSGRGRGGFLVVGGRRHALPADQIDDLDPLELLRRTFQDPHATTAPAAGGFALCHGARSPAHVAVDTVGRPVRVTSVTGRGELSVTLASYRPVDHVVLPHAIALYENGAPVLEMALTDLKLDIVVPDSHFERP